MEKQHEIAEQIRKYFEDNGITQRKVAETLGVSAQYVNGMCKGRNVIGKTMAENLEKYFGLSSSWLLTGKGEMLVYPNIKEASFAPHLQYDPEYVQGLLDEIERLKEENISLRAENNVLRELNGLPKRGVA